MYTPQAGIFALGTSSHAYLEFDLLDAKNCAKFASTISAIREPRTTTGGVNFVIGFRPELWRDILPNDAPEGVEGFNKRIQGIEGFVMPCTQHDALVWLSGSAYDIVFDKSGLSAGAVPVVLYSRDDLDFSQDVIAALNKNAPAADTKQ